jgi:cell division transport system permease protein
VSLHAVSYTLRRAFWSFRESPFTTFVTTATIAISLFIFNGFLLLEKNFAILLSGLGERVQIVVYLKDGLGEEKTQKLVERIEAHAEVKNSRYIPQEQAWNSFREGLGGKRKILDGLSEKILPSSIEVSLRDRARTPEGIRRLTQEWEAFPEVEDIQYGEEWIERLGFLIEAIDVLKLGLGGLLFLATLLIISNTIKLAIFARKDEIGVMRLVGATSGLIRAPFVVEGAILGGLGAGLALGALAVAYFSVRERIPPSLSFLFNPEQLQFLDLTVITLILGWGVLLGGCGSLFSCGRFLGD